MKPTMQSLSTFLHAPVLLASLALAACGGDDPIHTLPDAPMGPGGTDAGIDAPPDETGAADLSISINVAARAVVGTSLTYFLDVRNFSEHDASQVVVTYQLQAGAAQIASVSSSDADWACVANAQAVTCTRVALPIGSASLIGVAVTLPGSADTVSATAKVQASAAMGTDPVSSNNEATSRTDVVDAADLSIVQRTDATGDVFVGTNLTYTLEVANHGSLAATEVVVSDGLSRGLSFVRAEGAGWSCNLVNTEVVCDRDRIEANSTAPLLKIVTAVSDPEFTNLVSAEARVRPAPDEVDNNDNRVMTTTGLELRADLGITISDSVDPVQVSTDAPCTAATCITYTVTLTNHGPAPASGANALVSLPGTVSGDRGTFVDVVVPGVTCTGDKQVLCSWESLPVGTTTIKVRWKAPRTVPSTPLFALASTWALNEARDTNTANDEAEEQTAVRP